MAFTSLLPCWEITLKFQGLYHHFLIEFSLGSSRSLLIYIVMRIKMPLMTLEECLLSVSRDKSLYKYGENIKQIRGKNAPRPRGRKPLEIMIKTPEIIRDRKKGRERDREILNQFQDEVLSCGPAATYSLYRCL